MQESQAVFKELIFLLSPQPWENVIDILSLTNFEKLRSIRLIRGLNIYDVKKHIGVNDRIIGILEDKKSSLNLFKSRCVPFRNYLLYFQLLGITFLDLLITEPEELNEKGREIAELKKKKEYEWEQMMKAYREQNIMGPGMLYPFVKTKNDQQ